VLLSFLKKESNQRKSIKLNIKSGFIIFGKFFNQISVITCAKMPYCFHVDARSSAEHVMLNNVCFEMLIGSDYTDNFIRDHCNEKYS